MIAAILIPSDTCNASPAAHEIAARATQIERLCIARNAP